MVRLLLLVLLLYLHSIISLDTNSSPDSADLLDGITFNENSVTSTTQSLMDTVSPSSNSNGSHAGIPRANLSDCFHKSEEELMCFIGSGCLHHKPYYENTGVHQEFVVRYWDGLESIFLYKNITAIEECDVGATLYKRDGYIDLHGKPIDVRDTETTKGSRIVGTVNCCVIPAVQLSKMRGHTQMRKIIPLKNNTAQPNVTIETSVKLVNISSCFADPKTNCYLGASCLAENDGMSGNHSQITFLDQNSMVKENVSLQLEVEKCNVAAILKRIGKHRPASYEFEFQTTEGNLQLGFHHDGMNICVENGAVVCTPNCEFEQSIINESGTEKQLPRRIYWNGKINKRRDLDEEESEMGMILIICGCAVVALVIIAVTAGTIIQHRHNAKNKRKREAIQRATAAKAAKESSSSTNLHKIEEAPQPAIIPGETVPLTGGTIVSDDEPTSEKTTSTQFGEVVLAREELIERSNSQFPPSVKVKPQYEVNMGRCFRIPSMCFVGVNCLINGKGRHGRIVRVNNSIRYLTLQRKRIEECDVAAILIPNQDRELFATGKIQFDSSIKRANLKDCFKFNEKKLKCFVGDGCLEDVGSPHTKIVRFSDNDRIDPKYTNSSQRQLIENCDVGATLKALKTEGEYHMEYHTNSTNYKLPIRIDFNSNATQILRARNRKLSCSPHCVFYLESMINTDFIYWSGKLNIYNENRHIDYMTKFDKCIEGRDGNHAKIVKFSKKHREHFKNHPAARQTIEKCSVGAVFRPVEVKGFYEFEYHSTNQSLNLSIAVTDTVLDRVIRIEKGLIVCEPHCQYGDAYDSIAQESREEIRGLFWTGTFQFKAIARKITSLPRAPKLRDYPIPRPNEQRKEGTYEKREHEASTPVAENVDNKKEEDSLSLLGLILIICGCVLIVGIIAAVIIITIIPRRHNAKIKRKREALQKATAKAAKKCESSSSSCDERSKPPPVEETPLDEATPLGEDDPCSEVTTSTKFSVGENESSAMLYG
uniref:Uncharacterized protein n=1 Tax=Pristionchus pacificus TaxID=54126 RepID=A0A8R1YQ59_PRIPA